MIPEIAEIISKSNDMWDEVARYPWKFPWKFSELMAEIIPIAGIFFINRIQSFWFRLKYRKSNK